ncbi:hypothetical protein [Algoriphagus antarcticus]|uniref:hypothetical protein n=1 Tax=Algoriphagus antarcticus TaxID=238540 RepID=UPI000A3D542E|nr:hypothetical protein [Algoriphagus antarcticus]
MSLDLRSYKFSTAKIPYNHIKNLDVRFSASKRILFGQRVGRPKTKDRSKPEFNVSLDLRSYKFYTGKIPYNYNKEYEEP